MQLHQKLLALALVTSVMLPLVLAPAPTAAQIQQADRRFCNHCGAVLTGTHATEPGFKAGDKVQVVDGVLMPRP